MNSTESIRIGYLVIGRKRPGFDMPWGQKVAAAAWEAVEAGDWTAVRPSNPVNDDASLRAALTEFHAAGCDLLLVLQPTMGDGRLAPILHQLWPGPLVLWATPERQDSDRVSSCSLVGAHVFASTLRQLGHTFELISGDPADAHVREQLSLASRVLSAGRAFWRSTIGLVGYHAPGFVDIHADPFQISRDLGAQLRHIGLDEMIDLIQSVQPGDLDADLHRVKALKLPLRDELKEDDLSLNSRYYLAMRHLMDDLQLAALAVRCWPELPNRLGHWPYLAMSRLTDEQRVVALEGDVDGAMIGLIGRLLGAGAGYISDWLEHDQSTVTLWHPGHAPAWITRPGSASLGRHFNDNRPLVINAELMPDQPITLCRLWRCDGKYRMTAIEATMRKPHRPILGATGVAAFDGVDVPSMFDRLVHAGMPHHLTIFPGAHARLLQRFAAHHGMDWVGAI